MSTARCSIRFEAAVIRAKANARTGSGLSYTDLHIECLEVKMDTPAKNVEDLKSGVKPDPAPSPEEERRRRRIAALKAAEGLWKGRTDIPRDGAEYQNQLRAEWP
jgi:hypothetical protein